MALLLRLLLPLTVAVLLVYLGFIPFNWREPFENREVLMIFNAMLFAVIALLMGATPVHEADLGERPQTWLRRGVIALAALALLVSLYALAAILYRTVNGHLTPNRLLFIGWNVINIAILAVLLILQGRAGRARWLPAMHRTFAIGTVLYLIWSVVGLLAPPWLFRGDPAEVADLPPRIQQIVFDQPGPILLKCPTSPHIYLLEAGQKRWVKDIRNLRGRRLPLERRHRVGHLRRPAERARWGHDPARRRSAAAAVSNSPSRFTFPSHITHHGVTTHVRYPSDHLHPIPHPLSEPARGGERRC